MVEVTPGADADPQGDTALAEAAPQLPKDLQEKYAKCLTTLVDKSMKGDREDFVRAFQEIKYYGYNNDYTAKLYEQLPEITRDESAFKATINRVAEYVEIFGSYLYPQNPDASVVPMEQSDQWALKRYGVEAKALDYFMRQGGMETHARRALNEALMSGRGVVWFGYNARKGIPQVIFDSVENLSGDPDAKCLEEVNWVSRKRRKPRFVFKQLVPEALIDIDKDLTGQGADGDIIEYTEVYLRVGIHHYCKEQATADKDGPMEVDDSPKKYIIAENKLVAVDDWEIPFFQMDKWPCAIIDFRLQPEKIWPVSPIQPGLGHLRAMNWLYTFYINRVRRTTRVTFARLTHKGKALSGEATDMVTGADGSDDLGCINFEIPVADSEADIRKWFSTINLEHGIQEFDRMWALVNRAFEDATGLNDLMRAGQDSRQLRTAADVEFKEQRSLTRVEDLKKQVQVWLDNIMSMLCFTARYLLDQEDIDKFFGAEAAACWGRLGTPEEKQAENMQRLQQMNMAMQQAILGQQQAAMQAAAMPPDPMMVTPQLPPLPTPEQLEEQLGPPQIVVMSEWINEAKRQIVAGSMRVINHDAQVDNMNFWFSTIAPLAMPTPGGAAMVAGFSKCWAEANRYTPEMMKVIQQWQGTIAEAEAMMQQQAMMGQQQAPPEKQKPEPSQGREKAAKGMAQ
jgi:hypothetical protein